MINISLTGSTGFVGQNLSEYFKQKEIEVKCIARDAVIKNNPRLLNNINVIIHLAGKAHDLKNTIDVNQYYIVNTDLTKDVFDTFLASDATVFISLSSVKAIADVVNEALTENHSPNPVTDYGKSKLLAEQYILSKEIPYGKRIYILRPCMIHGPGNKGNLNLLFKLISNGFPWPLGQFENKRSYLSIDNLCFIIKELIDREDIPSGVYNVADDVPLSTNEVIQLIAESKGKKSTILKLSKQLITILARVGDFLNLPLNSERMQKLTESYIVNNSKIKKAIGKPLPISSRKGLLRTFKSFS